jgi:hypothetical protein
MELAAVNEYRTELGGLTPNVDYFKRNSASCPVSEYKLSADTGRLTPFRFKLKTTVIGIGLTPNRSPESQTDFL